jgi:hypothetical protein
MRTQQRPEQATALCKFICQTAQLRDNSNTVLEIKQQQHGTLDQASLQDWRHPAGDHAARCMMLARPEESARTTLWQKNTLNERHTAMYHAK